MPQNPYKLAVNYLSLKSKTTLWVGKIRFSSIRSKVPKLCGVGLRVSSGSPSIFSMILDHLEIIFENFSKS